VIALLEKAEGSRVMVTGIKPDLSISAKSARKGVRIEGGSSASLHLLPIRRF
jgi:hypothetical protein